MERNLEKQKTYRQNLIDYYNIKLDRLEESRIMYLTMIEIIEKQLKELE